MKGKKSSEDKTKTVSVRLSSALIDELKHDAGIEKINLMIITFQSIKLAVIDAIKNDVNQEL